MGNGLIEHELDHVFFGRATTDPVPDPAEVRAWRYVDMDELRLEMETYPERFTTWLRICLPLVSEQLFTERA